MSAPGGKADIPIPRARCPLLTQSGHWASISCCSSEASFGPYQSSRLSRYDVFFLSLGGGVCGDVIFLVFWVAAAAWPLAARAQQPERVRRVGLLTSVARAMRTSRPTSQRSRKRCSNWAGTSATTSRLIIVRAWVMPKTFANTPRNWSRSRRMSSWPLAGRPWGRLLQATRSVPIVFAVVPDPVGAGFVDSLSRPGGNATGFMQFEYSLSGKWLELLKEIAPGVTRAAVLRDPAIPAGIGQFAVIQSVAPSLGMEVIPLDAARCDRDRARHHSIRTLPAMAA